MWLEVGGSIEYLEPGPARAAVRVHAVGIGSTRL